MSKTIYTEIVNPNNNLLFTIDQLNQAKTNDKCLPVKCLHCGEIFYVSRKQYIDTLQIPKRTNLKFCCHHCAHQFKLAHNTSITKPCLNCGKLVTKYASEAQKHPNFFCCKSCATTYNNKHRNRSKKKLQNTTLRAPRVINKPKKHKACLVCGNINCTNKLHKSGYFRNPKSLMFLLGFDDSTLGSIKAIEEINRIRNMLYDLHWNKQLSCLDILRNFNINESKCHEISMLFKRLNIQIRSMSDISHVSALRRKPSNITSSNTHYRYKHGHHITWENIDVYYRSSYELDYCKYLDANHISYNMEQFRIEYYDTTLKKLRVAIPDFYLPHDHTIVEIKSTRTYEKQNMVDKSAQYKKLGYNFKLILDHKEYDYCP